MPLTDTAIRNAKPLDKPYKLSDAQGLYLLIKPNGSKLWQLKYRLAVRRRSWRLALTRPLRWRMYVSYVKRLARYSARVTIRGEKAAGETGEEKRQYL